MRNFLTVFILSAVALFSASTFAADNSAIKIGVLDLSVVLQSSPQMEKTATKLEAKFKPRQEEIEQLMKSVKGNEAKLKRDGTVLTKSDAEKLKDKIGSDQRRLRRLQEDYMTDARNAQKEAMDVVMKQVNEIVQKVADTGHFDLILQKSNVAFASKRIDISQKVIEQLKNKK